MNIGPYEIISPLGHGGMGVVYKARDPRNGQSALLTVEEKINSTWRWRNLYHEGYKYAAEGSVAASGAATLSTLTKVPGKMEVQSRRASGVQFVNGYHAKRTHGSVLAGTDGTLLKPEAYAQRVDFDGP